MPPRKYKLKQVMSDTITIRQNGVKTIMSEGEGGNVGTTDTGHVHHTEGRNCTKQNLGGG